MFRDEAKWFGKMPKCLSSSVGKALDLLTTSTGFESQFGQSFTLQPEKLASKKVGYLACDR